MRSIFLSLIFVAALCLAMSAGDFFPWPNLGGCVLMGLFSYLIKRKEIMP
jgi:hypothetical protein